MFLKKLKNLSLKLKITLWYTLVMIVLSVIVLAAMTSIGQNMTEQEISARIIRTVNDSSRMLFIPGRSHLDFEHFKYYLDGVHMVLYDNEKNIIGGQVPFGITETTDFADDKLRTITADGNKYFVYDKEIKHPNLRTTLWLRGIISITDESYGLRSAAKLNIALTIVLILIASIGGYIILLRAFQPVSRISRTALEISESNDLSRRINMGSDGDEITRLANSFDIMLDKIEQTFEREKQFTSDASHELRTPVAVILSECEYMEDCAKTIEDFKESASSVKRQTEKMSKLISELLTISRMDKNTLQLNFEETDLSELLTFVCDEQEEINSEKDIVLTRSITPGIFANTDRFLITSLFINLISNAYRYTDNDGKIDIFLYKDGEKIVFSVKDNGIGISKENLPKIWERFFQADPSRTANENGSMGLGLSMVKWIAESHGGNVFVDSKPGEGSEFTFVF